MFSKLFKSAPPSAATDRLERARAFIADGNVSEDGGRLQEARALYERAVGIAPELPTAHLNLGIAREALGDAAAARASYGQVLALDAGHPYGAYNLAKLDYLEGRLDSAASLLRLALFREPGLQPAWVLLSSVLDAQGNTAEAVGAIEQALRFQPNHTGALWNHAMLLQSLGRLDEAEAVAAQVVALQPDPDHLALHGALQAAQGFSGQALQTIRRAMALAPGRLDLQSRELFLLNVLEGVDPADLWRKHREFGLRLESAIPPQPSGRAHPAGRLRLGVVSEDLRVHPVALFLLPLLEGLPRERFEVFCYSSTTRPDHVTARIQALATRWVDAVGWPDAQLAQTITHDRIDILLDLQGHTGTSRLGVFAARPAPVQGCWVGYLNTSGLSRMDFRITDARCDPPVASQPLHAERLLYLPHSQWCYRPFVDVPPAAVAPCERKGHLTFGSFNGIAKLTDAMVRRWARVLRAVPDSRLLMADVSSNRKREAILDQLRGEGVATKRVEFAPRTDLEAYYRLMDDVDIALDTFPYGGGTTTLDALWMGVPVLTAVGDTPVSRSAASVLATLGLHEWIAEDIADYEERAVARARERDSISRLRRSLRTRLRASALMDEGAFVAAFAALLEQAWGDHSGTAAAMGDKPLGQGKSRE